MSTLPYNYQPLPRDNWIRILWLYPGEREDPIDTILLSITLEDAPEFEALSYVWGDNRNTAEIRCRTQPFKVTVNLRDALLHIRHPTERRTLWVDAMCINQNDIVERTKQVQMMGLIYYHAHRVIVWLGLDDKWMKPGSDDPNNKRIQGRDIFSFIKESSESLLERAESFQDIPPVTLEEFAQLDFRKWKAFASFCRQTPWFERAWVVQELGLAETGVLMCGTEELVLESYAPFILWLGKRAHLVVDHFNLPLGSQYSVLDYLLSCRNNLTSDLYDSPYSSFLQVLKQSRSVKCTDPRDHVYAFLGHPSAFESHPGDIVPYQDYKANYREKRRTIVIPDYTKTTEQIYLDVCVSLMDHMKGFQVLSYVYNEEGSLENEARPSWVPRWDVASPFLELGDSNWYTASGSIEPIYSVHSNELRVRGIEVDIVNFVEPIGTDFLQDLVFGKEQEISQLGVDGLWNTYWFRLWQKNPSLKANRQAFLYTLTAGMMGDDSLAEDHPLQFAANVAAFLAERIQSDAATGGKYDADRLERLREESVGGEASQFLIGLQRVTEGRMFFFTRKGYVGIGHTLTEVGDACWIICGARIPFILRERQGRYRMIGEAYVHEVMRGEAVNGVAPDELRDIRIY